MLPLVVGSALAMAALAYVLAPVLRGPSAARRSAGDASPALEAQRAASALEALREIEFDQATGKLSPEDYAALRATYAPRALAELDRGGADGPAEASGMHAAGHAPGAQAPRPAPEDAAEALIARARDRATSCPSCGPRPEGDALFCSDCGRYLAASCLRCGAMADDPMARFCGECGTPLAVTAPRESASATA